MTSATAATEAAAASGVAHRLVFYGQVQSAREAASARGVPLAALVKTLLVRLDADDYRFVAVPGDRALAWPKLRSLLGMSRLTMAAEAELVDLTGYVRGTVTPFGAKRDWPLIVDSALLTHAEISIGGGAHGIAIHLAPTDLVGTFDATVADVSDPE